MNRSTQSIVGNEVLISPPTQLTGAGVSGTSCSVSGSQYRCLTGTVAPGGTSTITLTGTAPVAPAILVVSAVTPVQSGESATSDNVASLSTPVRRTIPLNALVVDLFDRANSATLGVADTGQLWTTHSGSAGIQNNEISVTSALATLNTGVSGGDVSATVATVSYEFWMIVRWSDGQNYWRFGRWQDGPYQLQQIRGNQLGVPALQTLEVVQPMPGDLISCRVNVLGIDCAVNDVSVVRTSDTFNRTATRVGFSSHASPGARFDDFVVINTPAGPDLAVSVVAPSFALRDLQHTVHIDVRNNGDSIASATTLNVSIPSSFEIVSLPSGCTAGAAIQCSLGPALQIGGYERLSFILSTPVAGVVSSAADAVVAGDAFAGDNHVSWTTAVETPESGIFDNFARADAPTALGSTLTGQSWQTLVGTFGIANFEARASSGDSLAAIDAGFAFGTLEVVLGNSPTPSVRIVVACLRG